MSTNVQPTLALALDGHPMRDQLAGLAKTCIALDMKEKMGAALTPRFWSGVGLEVEDAVAKGLANIPISKILVEAWLSATQFRAYADPKVHPPGETSVATLAKHSIRSPHKLAVELLVNGTKTSTLVLELMLQFDLEAAHLRIRDGRIRALSLGRVAVSLTLKHASKDLKRISLRDLRFDDELTLDPPIPIMLPDRYALAVTLPADAHVPPVTTLRAD
jgi:hypothetical protein